MSNTFLTSSEITLEALRVLKNNLVAAKKVNRQFDKSFGVSGAKIGNVINARLPIRYLGGEGAGITPEDSVENSVPVRLDHQFNVAMQFTTADLLLSIDDFSRRFITPAVANLANRVDALVLNLYKKVPYFVGTPGSAPDDHDEYLQARAQLNNNAAPMDQQRSCVINPTMAYKLNYGVKSFYNPTPQISEAFEKGFLTKTAGFDFFEDQNVASHTVGAISGTPIIVSVASDGLSIVTSGWTAANTLKEGDIISIESSNAVNPQSRADLGYEQRFAVAADATAGDDTNMTIYLTQAIVGPGSAFQNVTAVPVAGKGVRVFGTAAASFSGITGKVTPQALAFHQDAFTLVCADLPEVKGVDMFARVSDEDLGISIRLIRDYLIGSDQLVTRLDVLCGAAVLRPEYAVRICG